MFFNSLLEAEYDPAEHFPGWPLRPLKRSLSTTRRPCPCCFET